MSSVTPKTHDSKSRAATTHGPNDPPKADVSTSGSPDGQPANMNPYLPNNPLVVAANALVKKPATQQRIRDLYAQNKSLVEMVDDLGLQPYLTDELRQLLTNLTPDVVDGIRSATFAMFANGGKSLPLNCDVTDADLADHVPVVVSVDQINGQPVIRCRAKPSGTRS